MTCGSKRYLNTLYPGLRTPREPDPRNQISLQLNEKIDEVARKLSGLSLQNYKNPYVHIDWPATLPDDAWYFREDLISIVDQPEYAALSLDQRKRLSFFEQINFLSQASHRAEGKT